MGTVVEIVIRMDNGTEFAITRAQQTNRFSRATKTNAEVLKEAYQDALAFLRRNGKEPEAPPAPRPLPVRR